MRGNLSWRVSRAVMIFALAVAVSVAPGLMAGTLEAAKTYRVIYPAGLDMEKAAMLVGWDLFLKDIKVEPVILKGQGSVARAVLSGKENLGYLTFSVFAKALAKGGKLVALAVSEQHLVWGIVVKNNVNSVKELKGKRFAVHAPGGISASIIDYYATKVGFKRTDFKMYYIRGGENRVAALLAGRIDATVAALIDANQALNTGKFKILSVFGAEAPDVIGPMLVSSPSFVKENPGVIQKLVTAAIKGMRLAYEDPKRFAKAVKKRAPYNDDKLFWQGHKDFMKYKLWAKNGGAPLLPRLQKALAWFGKNAPGEAKKMGFYKGFRLTSEHVYPRFVDAALKELGRK